MLPDSVNSCPFLSHTLGPGLWASPLVSEDGGVGTASRVPSGPFKKLFPLGEKYFRGNSGFMVKYL